MLCFCEGGRSDATNVQATETPASHQPPARQPAAIDKVGKDTFTNRDGCSSITDTTTATSITNYTAEEWRRWFRYAAQSGNAACPSLRYKDS